MTRQEYMKKYRLEHKEQIRKKNREYKQSAKYKEYEREYNKKYRQEHPNYYKPYNETLKKGNSRYEIKREKSKELYLANTQYYKNVSKRQYRKKRNAIKVWENVYGDLPKGCKIIHLDGNINNDKLDNLIVITQGDLFISNKLGLKLNINKDITETSLLLVSLVKKTHKLSK